MQKELAIAVDHYLTDLLLGADPALEAALADSAAAGLPAIAVSAPQGKLLHLLARTAGARRILEIGTLGGYSTIWLGRALPEGGSLVSLEFEPLHAHVAQHNLRRAGLEDKVSIRIGPAADSLQAMIAEGAPPFDFIFIDADKESYCRYLELSLQLSRPGTVLIADNVIREGEVINPSSTDSRVQGVRDFCQQLAHEQRIDATAIQTVGSKGYDGFVLGIVK